MTAYDPDRHGEPVVVGEVTREGQRRAQARFAAWWRRIGHELARVAR